VDLGTAIAIPLAAGSATLTNIAYLRQHDAAAAMPALSMRRPLHSVHLLVSDRSWLLGFAMETSGFLLYALALSLAPLSLVQSIAAGGIGVLAYVSARVTGKPLGRRRQIGVGLSLAGLVALGISLAKASGNSHHGSDAAVAAWLGGTAVLAVIALVVGRRVGALGVAQGIAGGLLFSIGDISVKLLTAGGTRVAFVVTLVLGYTLGTALLQLGYQRSGALTVAGLATLLTNAMPILAGTVVLGEPVPPGVFGALRVIAFIAVVAGAFLLATPDGGVADKERTPGEALPSPT
jgi:hypothetical protein